jgi:hypothetical protein
LQQAKQKQNMKAKYFSVIGLIGIALLGVCCKSGPESTPGTKRLSAADKTAIKEILRGAKPSLYRVQFDGGKDTMGSKKLTLAGVRQTLKTGSAGSLTFLADDGDTLVCDKGTQPNRVLEGNLGKEKAARLQAFAARFR